MSERETRDFMSVEAFSQLPFLRPAPPPSSNTSGIRLFGIEFNNNSKSSDIIVDHHQPPPPTPTKNSSSSSSSSADAAAVAVVVGESTRKFECHYCCRNFPTSQALGGHQNAHKRERQHAKRAHLQMAMAHHNHHNYDVGHPIYGLVDYHHRFGGHHHGPLNDPTRFYGGPGSFSQPINGSPLPGLWRVPAGMPLPLLGGEGSGLRRVGGSVAAEGGGGGGSVGQIQHVYGSAAAVAARVQDHVSLDLHL